MSSEPAKLHLTLDLQFALWRDYCCDFQAANNWKLYKTLQAKSAYWCCAACLLELNWKLWLLLKILGQLFPSEGS